MNGVNIETNKKGNQRGMHGHQPSGERHHRWANGRMTNDHGYVLIRHPEHPRADNRGYVKEHILVAERALGHPLPPQAVLHHWDRDPANNANGNLVVCEDQAYHRIIHRRQRAFEACGHADWLACRWCGKHEPPERLKIWRNGKAAHAECERERSRPYKQAYERRQRENAAQ